ncbi:MAG: dihydroorotate dehydrogenase electron transfer subunit, partial [bacterium]
MKKTDFEILENTRLTRDVWRLLLSGDTEGLLPGQFVNIAVPGRFLRRPISVCDAEAGKLTLLYKVVGEGTRLLSALPAGEKLELLTGLGTGYDLTLSGERPLLIGGGVGVPPLFFLAKRLLAEGKKPTVLLGFNTKEEIFHEFTFLSLG